MRSKYTKLNRSST